MAQFDLYENPNEETKRAIPYLLDVQSDLLAGLTTRVVVPLLTAESMGEAIKCLNPQVTVQGAALFMSTAELAGVPRRVLGPVVGSLKDRRDDIIAALDFLITGFLVGKAAQRMGPGW
jgi:toxin CcdB